jgi:hypothetical protein
MNNGEGSNKEGPRFSSQDNNLRRKLGSRNDKSKSLRFNSHNGLSLKENPEVVSIEVEKAENKGAKKVENRT